EITEQTAVKSINTLKKLKQKQGIVFAMDDFGSGYSNMLQLVEMAESGIISIIKIDGSLVKGIETSEKRFTLIKMLVEIAKTLNLQPVILEYVENQKTVELLNTLAHDVLYQGFYFDKALPIKTLLKKYTPQ
ncbi:MAG: EAL domain-containing protein, partial [Thiotrichales bacterium]|nr:EAL domain-containing protein [Thiotrichales bacterium]